jgi:hypothetical protein
VFCNLESEAFAIRCQGMSPYDMRLSAEERLSLESMARTSAPPYCDVIRAKIILLADEGLPNDLIAAIRAARSHAQPPATAQKDSLQIALPALLAGSALEFFLPPSVPRKTSSGAIGGRRSRSIDQSNGNGVELARRPAIVPAAASRENREPRAAELTRLYRDSALMPLRNFESRAVAFHGDAG